VNEELLLNKVLDPSRQVLVLVLVLVFYSKVGFIHDTVRMLGVGNLRCVAILKSNVRSMLAFHAPPPPTTLKLYAFSFRMVQLAQKIYEFNFCDSVITYWGT